MKRALKETRIHPPSTTTTFQNHAALEVICHGIPDRYVLNDGDILNIDITVFHDSFHGDLHP